jgi:arylsulfatase
MFKGYTSQGGVRVPAILKLPKAQVKQAVIDSMITVKDVLPTFLALTGIKQPGAGSFKGHEVVAMQGRSMLPLLENKAGNNSIGSPDDYYMGWEFYGKRGIRQGEWKITYVPSHESRDDRLPLTPPDQWQLFNLKDDPSEMHDLTEENPEKLQQMIKLWDEYAKTNEIVIPDKISGY